MQLTKQRSYIWTLLNNFLFFKITYKVLGETIRMKATTVILVGFLLSLVFIYILATNIENGDTNAISMYFVVFILPALVIAVINGIYVRALNKLTGKTRKGLLSLVPIIILSILSLSENLTIPGIDGNLTFTTTVGAIALGLTNLFWIISLVKGKSDDQL
jgi:uncharacterized integral membrane protein